MTFPLLDQGQLNPRLPDRHLQKVLLLPNNPNQETLYLVLTSSDQRARKVTLPVEVLRQTQTPKHLSLLHGPILNSLFSPYTPLPLVNNLPNLKHLSRTRFPNCSLLRLNNHLSKLHLEG